MAAIVILRSATGRPIAYPIYVGDYSEMANHDVTRSHTPSVAMLVIDG